MCLLNLACVNGHVDFAHFLVAEKLYDVNGECARSVVCDLGLLHKFTRRNLVNELLVYPKSADRAILSGKLYRWR